MTTSSFTAKTLPIAALTSIVLVWLIHQRAGDETFLCDGVPCELGSGGSWLLTGAAATGPFVVVLGAAWSRRLHHRDRLGPFASRVIPDGEQIVEVLAVLVAGLATYWLLRNGPMIEAVENGVGRPNSWLLDARELADEFDTDRHVPTRRNWFMIGTILAAPFAFSTGSMIGREWYGHIRRRTQIADSRAHDDVDIDLTMIDLTDPAENLPIDER